MKTLFITLCILLLPFKLSAEDYSTVTLSDKVSSLLDRPNEPLRRLPIVSTTIFENSNITSGHAPINGAYKCLSFEQWKQILLQANDYKGLYNWRMQMSGVVSGLMFILNQTEALLANYELQLEIYKQDREYLQYRLKQDSKLFKSLNKSNKIEKVALWSIIAAQAIGVIVLSVKSFK